MSVIYSKGEAEVEDGVYANGEFRLKLTVGRNAMEVSRDDAVDLLTCLLGVRLARLEAHRER